MTRDELIAFIDKQIAAVRTYDDNIETIIQSLRRDYKRATVDIDMDRIADRERATVTSFENMLAEQRRKVMNFAYYLPQEEQAGCDIRMMTVRTYAERMELNRTELQLYGQPQAIHRYLSNADWKYFKGFSSADDAMLYKLAI